MAIFIGQTRFSLYIPNNAGWRLTGEESGLADSDYRARLYDDSRLSFRTEVFCELSIPQIAAAKGEHEVFHVATLSESLPEKYKKRLIETAKQYPFLILDEVPDNSFGSISTYFRKYVSQGRVFGSYRLDDDDILGIRYFDQMSQYIDERFVGMTVSLPLGVEAIYQGGYFSNFRNAHVPMHSMGLMHVCRHVGGGGTDGPVAGPHDLSDRYAPVIIDARVLGFLRINHLGQDNIMRFSPDKVEAQIVRSLETCSPTIDPDLLDQNFPVFSSRVFSADIETVVSLNAKIDGECFFLLDKATSSLTVKFVFEHPSRDSKTDYVISYLLKDRSGRIISPTRRVDGIGTSKNPYIGQFQYLIFPKNRTESITSIHFPNGVRIAGFKILRINATSEEIYFQTVSAFGAVGQLRDSNKDEFLSLLGRRYGAFPRVAHKMKQLAKGILGRVRETLR